MNIDIDSSVYNIFIAYPLIYSLFNERNQVLLNGITVFYGGHENYISFISSLGLPILSIYTALVLSFIA